MVRKPAKTCHDEDLRGVLPPLAGRVRAPA